MQEEILIEFAKKWEVDSDVVYMIYVLIRERGNHYGKVSHTLEKMNILLSARQLKYFYRRAQFCDRYGSKSQIGQNNFRNSITKKS